MRRFYLSKIREVFDPTLGTNVWRHRFQDPGFEDLDLQGGEIASDPQTGIPTQVATLVLVGGINHAPLAADDELAIFPDVPLDLKVSGIHVATKNLLKAKIKALGFTAEETESIWTNADGVRDAVTAYGRKNNPGFDADNFDLYEA